MSEELRREEEIQEMWQQLLIPGRAEELLDSGRLSMKEQDEIVRLIAQVMKRGNAGALHLSRAQMLYPRWPAASWNLVLEALLERVAQERSVRVDDATLAGFVLLFWNELKAADLPSLYLSFLTPGAREAIAHHPYADLAFWKQVVESTRKKGFFYAVDVLSHAASFEVARSSPELLQVMLDSHEIRVYLELVKSAQDDESLSRYVGTFVRHSAPALAYHLLEAIEPSRRSRLGDACMPLLQHPGSEIRLQTQQLLLGGSILENPGKRKGGARR